MRGWYCLLGLVLGAASTEGFAMCKSWGQAEQIGSLDHEVIPEASGLALSRIFSDRLYHVNDSGSEAYFHVTDTEGNTLQSVKMSGFTPQDAEDLALGACGVIEGSCLFVADTGDNDGDRDYAAIGIFEEKAKFAKTEKPLHTIKLTFPDGAHNVEGIALHPSGDLFLVSKDDVASIYKITASDWQASIFTNSILVAEEVGTLDLAPLSGGENEEGIVTAFDISADGKSFLLLTEAEVFAIDLNLANTRGVDFDAQSLLQAGKLQILEVEVLKKQEGIAFLPDGKGFIYSTESKKKDAPLMQITCDGV